MTAAQIYEHERATWLEQIPHHFILLFLKWQADIEEKVTILLKVSSKYQKENYNNKKRKESKYLEDSFMKGYFLMRFS